jgi:hypothetical protein
MDKGYIGLMLFVAFLLFATKISAQNPSTKNQTSNIDQPDFCAFSALIDQAVNARDSLRRTALYYHVLGVLSELNSYRYQFLRDGSLINIFPTVYYHVSYEEMIKIKNGFYCYPIEKMEQIIAFFDAFKYNRLCWDSGNIGAIEAHWIEYFKFANDSKISFYCCKLSCALALGIDAHVKCDLPRALGYTFKNTTVSQGRLFDEFITSHGIFEIALGKTIEDINTLNTCGKMMDALNNNFSDRQIHSITDLCCYPFDSKKTVYLASDVVYFRNKAWMQSIDGSVIKNLAGSKLGSQPVLDHANIATEGLKYCLPSKKISN